jgi:hypothetical protein
MVLNISPLPHHTPLDSLGPLGVIILILALIAAGAVVWRAARRMKPDLKDGEDNEKRQ